MGWDVEDLAHLPDGAKAEALNQIARSNRRAAAVGAPTLDTTVVARLDAARLAQRPPILAPPADATIYTLATSCGWQDSGSRTVFLVGDIVLVNEAHAMVRQQRAKVRKDRRLAAAAVAWQARLAPIGWGPSDVIVHHVRRRAAQWPDADSVAFAAKSSLDGLTKAGYRYAELPAAQAPLEDDRPAYVHNWIFTPPAEGAVEALIITLRPAVRWSPPHLPKGPR